MMFMVLVLLNVLLILVPTAVSLGNADIVQLLLDKGAKLTVLEHGRFLQIAEERDYIQIIDLLNRKGFKNKVKKGVMESLLERNEKIMTSRTEKLNSSFISLSKLSIKGGKIGGSPRRLMIPERNHVLMHSAKPKRSSNNLEVAPTQYTIVMSTAPLANAVPKTMEFNSYKRLKKS